MKIFRAISAVSFLSLLMLFNACKKDNDSNKEDEGFTWYYFKGDLDGVAFNWRVKKDTDWSVGTGASSIVLNGEGLGNITALLEKNQPDPSMDRKPSLGLTFQTYTISDGSVSAAVFNDFIKTGAWAYAADDQMTANTKNIVVEYQNEQGDYYHSIGSQSGSAFSVSEVKLIPATFFANESLRIKVNLNCKLYPKNGNGPSLTLSNGEAVLYMENILNFN